MSVYIIEREKTFLLNKYWIIINSKAQLEISPCLRFNTSIQNYFSGTEDKGVANGNAVLSELEDGNAYYEQFWDDPSWPLLSSGKGN